MGVMIETWENRLCIIESPDPMGLVWRSNSRNVSIAAEANGTLRFLLKTYELYLSAKNNPDEIVVNWLCCTGQLIV